MLVLCSRLIYIWMTTNPHLYKKVVRLATQKSYDLMLAYLHSEHTTRLKRALTQKELHFINMEAKQFAYNHNNRTTSMSACAILIKKINL